MERGFYKKLDICNYYWDRKYLKYSSKKWRELKNISKRIIRRRFNSIAVEDI